jgi:hypothetical protein
MKNPYPTETGCCPRFNPEPWDEKEIHWDNKLFVKDKVRCFLYMPLNFGKVMTRLAEKIDKADAYTPEPPVCLSDHTSKWTMDLYIAVTKPVEDAEMTTLSGTFLTKVFEGPYKNAKLWCDQMRDWVTQKGKAIKRHLMYYTTCPKCAKHYGKNYVVYFAQI